jgi:hypothetical protein
MVLSFFWVFCNSLPNQVEQTWLKLQLHIGDYKRGKIIFIDEGVDSNFNTVDLVKFHGKNQKL